ncbi:fimbria/pilus periplasmic chaperone [Cupriavidus basilensis]
MTDPIIAGRGDRRPRCERAWRRAGAMLALLLCLAPAGALAALSIIGTRFVYPADLSALSVRLRNAGDSPILVQAWLDQGEVNADPASAARALHLVAAIAQAGPGAQDGAAAALHR